MDSHPHAHTPAPHLRSSDDDGTYVGEDLSHQHSNVSAQANQANLPRLATGTRARSGTHLTVETQYDYPHQMQSPSQTREQQSRLDDDLAVLQIERGIIDAEALERGNSTTRSMQRVRSRRDEPIDDFDAATNPLHEQAARYKPPENPSTKFSKFFKKLHGSSWVVRYITYISPVVLLILIPLLVGIFAFPDANVGGVELLWFSIWLMIVWLTLWAGRVCFPVRSSKRFLIYDSFLRNYFHGLSVSSLACSPTTVRNGEIWVNSWSCRQLCSSGGWPLKYPSFRQ
jgi:hypothetical protein